MADPVRRPPCCRCSRKLLWPAPNPYPAFPGQRGTSTILTPIPVGLAACIAAAITSADSVLEPSAGTGLLAIFAELAGGTVVLNELAEARANLLDHLFPATDVTRFNAAQIDYYRNIDIVPAWS